jgi:hypothetical protein
VANATFATLWVELAMRTPARIALPVIFPRAVMLWALVRLIVASLPLATGAPFGSIPPSPIAIVLLCGVVGLVDVSVRGERILWANLGVHRRILYAAYAATAIPAECLLALVLR